MNFKIKAFDCCSDEELEKKINLFLSKNNFIQFLSIERSYHIGYSIAKIYYLDFSKEFINE